MGNIKDKKKTRIDIHYALMFNKLISPFSEDYHKERIIRNFCKKYQLESSVGFMYELYLKGGSKTGNTVASSKPLLEFVEDASELFMAVFFRHIEEIEL